MMRPKSIRDGCCDPCSGIGEQLDRIEQELENKVDTIYVGSIVKEPTAGEITITKADIEALGISGTSIADVSVTHDLINGMRDWTTTLVITDTEGREYSALVVSVMQEIINSPNPVASTAVKVVTDGLANRTTALETGLSSAQTEINALDDRVESIEDDISTVESAVQARLTDASLGIDQNGNVLFTKYRNGQSAGTNVVPVDQVPDDDASALVSSKAVYDGLNAKAGIIEVSPGTVGTYIDMDYEYEGGLYLFAPLAMPAGKKWVVGGGSNSFTYEQWGESMTVEAELRHLTSSDYAFIVTEGDYIFAHVERWWEPEPPSPVTVSGGGKMLYQPGTEDRVELVTQSAFDKALVSLAIGTRSNINPVFTNSGGDKESIVATTWGYRITAGSGSSINNEGIFYGSEESKQNVAFSYRLTSMNMGNVMTVYSGYRDIFSGADNIVLSSGLRMGITNGYMSTFIPLTPYVESVVWNNGDWEFTMNSGWASYLDDNHILIDTETPQFVLYGLISADFKPSNTVQYLYDNISKQQLSKYSNSSPSNVYNFISGYSIGSSITVIIEGTGSVYFQGHIVSKTDYRGSPSNTVVAIGVRGAEGSTSTSAAWFSITSRNGGSLTLDNDTYTSSSGVTITAYAMGKL